MQDTSKQLGTAPSRILLVEDDEDLRQRSRTALREHWPQSEVAVARDGQAAIDLLDRWYEAPVGLVFLDIQMPGMDGRAFLETWYRNRSFSEPPVVVVYEVGNDDRIGLAEFGCVRAFLPKPLTVESLRTLRDTLGG